MQLIDNKFEVINENFNAGGMGQILLVRGI